MVFAETIKQYELIFFFFQHFPATLTTVVSVKELNNSKMISLTGLKEKSALLQEAQGLILTTQAKVSLNAEIFSKYTLDLRF